MFYFKRHCLAISLLNEKITMTSIVKRGGKLVANSLSLKEGDLEKKIKNKSVVISLSAEYMTYKKISMPSNVSRKNFDAYIKLKELEMFGKPFHGVSFDYYIVNNSKTHKNDIHLYFFEKNKINFSFEKENIYAVEIEYQALFRLLRKINEKNEVVVLILIIKNQLTLMICDKTNCFFAKNFYFEEDVQVEKIVSCCELSIDEVVNDGVIDYVDKVYFYGVSFENYSGNSKYNFHKNAISFYDELIDHIEFEGKELDFISIGAALRGFS